MDLKPHLRNLKEAPARSLNARFYLDYIGQVANQRAQTRPSALLATGAPDDILPHKLSLTSQSET